MKLYGLICFCFLAGICSAKSDSIAIRLDRLQYSSEFEKNQFTALSKKGTFDPLLFLYCLDTTTTEASAVKFRQKLNSFFDEKLVPGSDKNSEKAIKATFKEIHDKLLTKYEEGASFESLLDKGIYNCLTASALYAMAFDRLQIPYQLRSTTSHVYVIANPGPQQITIESTDPVGGVFSYNDSYKKTYIEMLVKQKMISKEEFNQSSQESLFQKYFYSSDTINMKQLIGLHYYNNGVALYNNDDYSGAVNQLQKAYYLNGSKQVSHMLYLALGTAIAKRFEITDTLDVERYFMFMRLGKLTDYDPLFTSYQQASQELLVRNDDLPTFEGMSAAIFKALADDSANTVPFKEHYYYAKAYAYITKKDYVQAYINIAKAHCINSKNIQIKSMYETLNEHIYYYLVEEVEEDSMEIVINNLEKIKEDCSGIKANLWSTQLAWMRVTMKYEDNEVAKGDLLLENAEKLIQTNKPEGLNDVFIENAYEAGENYYYRKGDYVKAKQYINRGLKVLPDNKKFKSTLAFLNERIAGPKYSPPPMPPANRNYNNTKPAPRTVIVKTPH